MRFGTILLAFSITISTVNCNSESDSRVHNNNNYKKNGNDNLTCQKIRKDEVKRQEQCQDTQVRDNCPQTCGISCVDDDSYTFDKFKTTRKMKGCDYLSKKKRRKEFCKQRLSKRMVRDACPKACNKCKDFVPLDRRGGHSKCADLTDFRVNGHSKKDCTWVGGPKRVATQCSKSEVAENCAITCWESDSVCCDNANFEFNNNQGVSKKCMWLSGDGGRAEKYCDVLEIKRNCKAACGECTSARRMPLEGESDGANDAFMPLEGESDGANDAFFQ